MEGNQDQVKDMPGIGHKSESHCRSNLPMLLDPWVGSRPEPRWERKAWTASGQKSNNGSLYPTRRGYFVAASPLEHV